MDYEQAVIASKSVTEGHSQVVFAAHSKGGWQFYGGEMSTDAEVWVTKLKTIVSANSHVKDILWIPEGMEASFDPNRKTWRIQITESE